MRLTPFSHENELVYRLSVHGRGAVVPGGFRPRSIRAQCGRAKQLGATHIVITEDLPPALWEMDVPGDPYPAWYMYHPGLLKIFPPAALEKYIDRDYAEKWRPCSRRAAKCCGALV